jgi:DNA processing protein
VVIVVEAAAKSGALITARCALDHDRFVIAVPGDLSRETSVGTNLLIRDGAHPLTEMEAVIEEIELVLGPAPRNPGHGGGVGFDSELFALVSDHSISIDQIAADSGMDVSAVLSQLAVLEVSGAVILDGGMVRRR